MSITLDPRPSRPVPRATGPGGAISVGSYGVGVRTLLFLILGASAVAPVVLFGLDQARRWGESELEATDRQALAAARAAADELSFAMLSSVRAVETVAGQLGGGVALDLDKMGPVVDAHTRHHPEFIGAYVADARGKSVLFERDGRPGPTGIDYSDRDYYREILRTGRTAISSAVIGRMTGVLSVQVVAPIQDANGQLLGLVCSSVDLGGIAQQAKGSARGMSHGRLVVVDGLGRRIADSAADAVSNSEDLSALPLFARVLSGDAELRIGEDDQHQAVRGTAVNLGPPVPSWRVVAITPQSDIDAQAKRVRQQITELVCVLVLAALALSAVLAAWLARPLRALAMTAEAVARGDLHWLPPVPVHAPREMALLAEAVRGMIVELGSHAYELERKVDERTLALLGANAELSNALETIRQHEREQNADIEKARIFQAKLLPKLPVPSALDIAVHYAPLAQVSGDIYDVLALPNGTVRIFLADATGHGVQASMRTLLLKSAYDRLKLELPSPGELLTALNHHLVAEFPDGDLHCSACCVDVQPRIGGATVRYSNAGAPPLYVHSPRDPLREIYGGSPLLGVDEFTWSDGSCFDLQGGELLLIASDGLVEQSNPTRQRFDSRLPNFRQPVGSSARSALDEMLRDFVQFVADEPVRDDVTIIAVRSPDELEFRNRRLELVAGE